jgi:putative transposase
MAPLSYGRHRFPPTIIQHAICLYLRFTLSYRDVEDLLAERGLEVSYETVRRWVLKFGPLIARKLRQGRPRPSARWISTRWSSGSPGSGCTCGVPSTMRAKSTNMLVQGRRDPQAALRISGLAHGGPTSGFGRR